MYLFMFAAAILLSAILVYGFTAPWWPMSSLDRQAVARFAAAHRLFLTVASGQYVVAYLVRSLRWRRWGGLVGAAVGVPLAFVQAHTPRTSGGAGGLTSTSSTTELNVNWLVLVGVGYFVGALVAECRSGASASGPNQLASLQPRRRADYLEPELIRTAYLTLLIAAGLVTSTSVWPHYAARTSLWQRFAMLGCIAAVVGVIEGTTRWIVKRPLPVDHEDLGAARNAVRASCVYLLAGVGVAFCWYLLAVEAYCCGQQPSSGDSTLVDGIAVAAALLCVRSWFRLRRRAWSATPRTNAAGT
jgi:hypothetical protein